MVTSGKKRDVTNPNDGNLYFTADVNFLSKKYLLESSVMHT